MDKKMLGQAAQNTGPVPAYQPGVDRATTDRREGPVEQNRGAVKPRQLTTVQRAERWLHNLDLARIEAMENGG